MHASTDRGKALRLLQGLEAGGVSAAEAQTLAQDLDPVLVYFIVRFLREVFPASNPATSAVLERVTKLTSAYPGLVDKSKEGERDPVAQWFAGQHSLRGFRGRGRELIEMIVEKLES